jgi:oligosaccharide repeat unit polymerase
MTSKRGFKSMAALYFICLCVFHLGFVVPYELGYQPGAHVGFTWLRWYNSVYTDHAIILVSLGFAGFTFGSILVNSLYNKSSQIVRQAGRSRRREKFESPKAMRLDSGITVISISMMLLGIVIWFATLVSKGGLGIFFASYYEYLIISQDSILTNISYLFISTGVALLVCTKSSKIHKIGFRIFLLWSILAFMMGLRGEVMFPMVTCIAIYSRKGEAANLGFLAVAVLGLLVVVSGVREIRDRGVAQAELSMMMSGPLEGLVELGAQLRPMVVVQQWDAQGYDRLYGGSYYAPFERMFLRVFPVATRIPAEEDPRILNYASRERVGGTGGIGFSPLAEAWFNFGEVGVLIVLSLFGALFSRLDVMNNTIRTNVLSAVIFLPFLLHVRNAFTPLPGQIVFGFILITMAMIYARMRKSKSDL